MTDLAAKFTTLETQLATQHTELMAALAGLTGLATSIDTLNNTLQAMATANSLYYDATLELQGLIANNLDLMLINNSLNAQRILAMILATACPCDDATPLPPPLLPDPTTEVDIAKCARIQYFIDLYFSWVVDLGTYLSSGGISNIQVNTLLARLLSEENITTGELSVGIPQYVRDSIVHLIANSEVQYIELSHLLIATSDNDLKEILRQALYNEDNAVSGSVAFLAAIDSMELPQRVQDILKAMFYSAWGNDIYSLVPVVDTSEFDGTICAGVACDQLYSETYSGSNLDFTTDTFAGWDEYRVRITTTGGSALLHVYVAGVEEHTWAAPHDETFTASGDVYLRVTSSGAASGDLLWEGCPSIWGGS